MVPPLPQIHGELFLDVMTHRSLGEGAPVDTQHGGTERLASIGQNVLDLAITTFLFAKRPMLSAPEIATEREKHTKDEVISTWVDACNLRAKFRCMPNLQEQIKSPFETRFLFTSYIGAVFFQSGMAPIQQWVNTTLDSEAELHMPPGAPNAGSPLGFPGHQLPIPPSSPPPPLPSGVPSPLGVASPILPIFNMRAAQSGLTVSYSAASVGPPHLPTWTVRCLVNSVEKGVGIAKNQKNAKEESARQAMQAMGWHCES